MRVVSKLCLLSCTAVISGCFGSGSVQNVLPTQEAHINDKTKFSEAKYGVAASPRVTTSRKVRKGGGRSQVGKPYKIKGKWYTPKEDHSYNKTGNASWYGPNFHGRLTANGEVYDQYALSGAHPTFPLPSYARVTNMANGKSVIVRVNDRGPYHEGRIIDLSAAASEMLDYQKQGIAKVNVKYVGRAPLHGLDHKYLAASYKTGPVLSPSRKAVASLESSRKGPRPQAEVSNAVALDPVSTGAIKSHRLRKQFIVDAD